MATVFDNLLGRIRTDKTMASTWATLIQALSSKVLPADADQMALVDVAGGNVMKKTTMANLKTFFGTIFALKVGTEDIEISDATNGLVLKDRTTSSRYRIFIDNGVLGIESL